MHLLFIIIAAIFSLAALLYAMRWILYYTLLLREIELNCPEYYQAIKRPSFGFSLSPTEATYRQASWFNYLGKLFSGNPLGFPDNKKCLYLADKYRKNIRLFILLFYAMLPFYAAAGLTAK